MKRSVVSTLVALGIAAFGLAISAAPALADTVEITVLPGGNAYWDGAVGDNLTLAGNNVTVIVTDGSASAEFTGVLTASTGGEISGIGSTASPYTFDANNTPGAITVADLTDLSAGFTDVTGNLFAGTITGASLTMGSGADGSLTFVVGTVNPNLLADFGATGGNSYGGSVSTALSGNSVVSLTMGSSDVLLTPTPTPEPSSMLLLGSGLLSLVGFRRRKVALYDWK
jgi:hypothetical protein